MQIIPCSGALSGGGEGALDSLFAGGYTNAGVTYYAALLAGDTVFYHNGGIPIYYRWVEETSPQTELAPDIIVPDFQSDGVPYTGNGAWHLVTGDVLITHTGATFAPTITVAAGAHITWTFTDGTTSSSATPNKSFGSAATRVTRLNVTPWSSLTRVNVGYDAGDGGSASIETVAACSVTKVENMYLMAPYLRQWCSSHNNIPALNFDNFVLLDTIECYQSTGMVNVSLHNTPLLARACFEGCSLTYIDFSESPSLADFRGAGNLWNGWNWGATGLHLWHYCSHSCPNINAQLPSDGAQFPIIQELWISNNDLTGKLRVKSPVFSSLSGAGNHWTEADFTGCFPTLSAGGSIDLDGNELTSLIITGCIGLDTLSASDNNLSAEMVTSVLQVLDAGGNTGGTVDLSGNAIPTAAGITAARNLEGKGWTVTIDEAAATLTSIVVTPDDGSLNVGATQQFTATGHYSDNSTANITSTVTWDSSDDTYATITSGGLATGVAAGVPTISATLGEITGDTTLTVNAVTLSSIAVTPATPSIAVGGTQQFTATGTYSDSSTADITTSCTWTSGTPATATIGSGTGLATAVAEGTSEITATLGAVHNHANITVTAASAPRISFTTTGSHTALSCETLNSDTDLTWHWSDGTTSTGLTPSKDFGTAATREHYMTMTTPANLTRITNGGTEPHISTISGFSGFENFNYVLFYLGSVNDEITSIDISDCPNLRQVHMAHTMLTAAQVDQMLIDMDNSLTGATPAGTCYYPNIATSASAAARTSLTNNKGIYLVPIDNL